MFDCIFCNKTFTQPLTHTRLADHLFRDQRGKKDDTESSGHFRRSCRGVTPIFCPVCFAALSDFGITFSEHYYRHMRYCLFPKLRVPTYQPCKASKTAERQTPGFQGLASHEVHESCKCPLEIHCPCLSACFRNANFHAQKHSRPQCRSI